LGLSEVSPGFLQFNTRWAFNIADIVDWFLLEQIWTQGDPLANDVLYAPAFLTIEHDRSPANTTARFTRVTHCHMDFNPYPQDTMVRYCCETSEVNAISLIETLPGSEFNPRWSRQCVDLPQRALQSNQA